MAVDHERYSLLAQYLCSAYQAWSTRTSLGTAYRLFKEREEGGKDVGDAWYDIAQEIDQAMSIRWEDLSTNTHHPRRVPGEYNGIDWERYGERTKIRYLIGFRDGMRLVDHEMENWADDCTVEHYLKELDGFYREPKNMRIPIYAAFSYATEKLSGKKTGEELELLLSHMQEVSQQDQQVNQIQ